MAPIHHRMPVIIRTEDVQSWLSKDTNIDSLKDLFKPVQADFLSCYQVSDYVNSSRNISEKCIEKII